MPGLFFTGAETAGMMIVCSSGLFWRKRIDVHKQRAPHAQAYCGGKLDDVFKHRERDIAKVIVSVQHNTAFHVAKHAVSLIASKTLAPAVCSLPKP